MSEESVRDLFDRWERVWHEGRYDLVAECVAKVYTRHDESGTRRVTLEEYAAEVTAARQERPNTRFVVYDHDIAGDRAWFPHQRRRPIATLLDVAQTHYSAAVSTPGLLLGRVYQYRASIGMDAQTHWEKIYTEKAPDAVSWYRPHLETSLELIEQVAADRSISIIDVGGGESTLIDDLLARGHQNITVLDISHTAIEANRQRLGEASERVQWLVGDITKIDLPTSAYDVWHDRAVFHFLTMPGDRVAYVRQVAHAVSLPR